MEQSFIKKVARERPELEAFAEAPWPDQAEYDKRTARQQEIEDSLAAETEGPKATAPTASRRHRRRGT